MPTYEYHEAANIFPMMEGEAFDELAADIKRHGLRDDIELLDGKIIDGRNRFKACEAAGVKPRYKTVTVDDPVDYVLSKNLHRRHLTPSQASMVAARVRDYYDRQAKERQKRKPVDSVPEKLPEQKGDSRDQAGKDVGVSGKTVDAATKVLKRGVPELVKAVDQGRMSVSMAAKIVTEDEETQKRIAETAKCSSGRYRNSSHVAKGSMGVTPARRPASNAMQFAILAISQLERILDDDPGKEKAFAKVETWIANRRKGK
jgi:hypothetical protein